MEENITPKKEVPESFKAYEDGKHRRYTLLFAVNGGAFAIAKLITEKQGTNEAILGNLSIFRLAIGMVLFTVVMTFDIFTFGEKMRKNYLPKAFSWQGKIVLILIGILICAGWILVT